MVSDKYRMHRLRSGDEQVLSTLAKGNARFGDGEADGGDTDWQAPLGSDEAAQFVADPNTVCIVAIDMATSHIAGFIYGGALKRRHTRLHHMCLYEVGVDVDHRKGDVGMLLMQAFAAEARKLGIERGFVITNDANGDAVKLYEAFGAVRGDGNDRLFGLSF